MKKVAAEMLSTRRIASTWHGLVVDDLTRGTQRAVVITEVQAGSPGESAGFKAGDEVMRVGELPVGNMLDLERGLLDSQPGRPTKLAGSPGRWRPDPRTGREADSAGDERGSQYPAG